MNLKILTFFTFLGTIFVDFNQNLIANIIWGTANPILAYHSHKIGQKELMYLFLAYAGSAWLGIALSIISNNNKLL